MLGSWRCAQCSACPDWSWKAVSLARVVRANQTLSQAEPEGLYGCGLVNGGVCDGLEVLVEDEGVDSTAIEQEPKNIPVELPGLTAYLIVAPELVRPVYTPHVPIVLNDTGWTRYWLFGVVRIPPCYCCVPFRLTVRGHDVH